MPIIKNIKYIKEIKNVFVIPNFLYKTRISLAPCGRPMKIISNPNKKS
jgi:hypothetical protein